VAASGCGDEAARLCPDRTSICRASLRVPLDHAAPAGEELEVGFVLVPPRDRTRPAAGTLVWLTGGPGYPAIPDQPAIEQTFGGLLADRALLLMDYRGTGSSSPLACELGVPESVDPTLRPTPAQIAACVEGLGERATHFGTAAAMDDLEALRVALDLGPLDVVGTSYGTMAAEVYALRHPAGVRTVTLNAGPGLGIPDAPWALFIDAITVPMQAMDAACSRRGCPGAPPSARWSNVVARIRAGGDPALDLQAAVLLHRYATADGLLLPAFLDALAAYEAGDPTSLHALAAELAIGDDDGGGAASPSEDSTALFLHVMCNDWALPFDRAASPAARRVQLEAAIEAIPAEAFAPFTREEWRTYQAPIAALCVDWTLQTRPSVPSAPATAAPPALVVVPELDPTSVRPADAILKRLPGARRVDLELGSHAGLFESQCARSAVERFIATAVADDLRCAETAAAESAP
jgi:pimeloyl-ACP methyl ester carboxylesterase